MRVFYFGVLKDVSRCGSEDVDLADGASVGDVVLDCRARFGEAAGIWGSIAVAVNRHYARFDDGLRDGDEVALLPPVSGGTKSYAR